MTREKKETGNKYLHTGRYSNLSAKKGVRKERRSLRTRTCISVI